MSAQHNMLTVYRAYTVLVKAVDLAMTLAACLNVIGQAEVQHQRTSQILRSQL